MWRLYQILLGLLNPFMNKNHDICPIWHGIRMGLGLKHEKITLLHLSLLRDFLNKYRGSSPMWRQCIMYLGLPKSFMNKNHDIGPIWPGIRMILGLKSAFRTISVRFQDNF